MKRYMLVLGALIVALAAFTSPATADDQVIAQAAASPSPSPSPTPPPKPFQWSAYADGGYTNASTSLGNHFIAGRVFDNVSGTPQFQDLNLTTSYTGTIGAKFELNYGTDAVVIHSYPMNPTVICPGGLNGITPTCTPPYNPQADITQAYLSYSTGKFSLIVGKFETLAGAEVIESPSDLEYSRSILFGYAVPFTHTGARLTFAATPTLNIIVGGNRGWDTTYGLSSSTYAKLGAPAGTPGDTSSITAELGAAYTPSSVFSLTAQGYIGSQEDWAYAGCATNSNCNRSLFDAVATYHIDSNLTAIVNVDSGSQTGTCNNSFLPTSAPTTLCGSGQIGTVNWGGVAGYLSEAWNSNLTTSVRYESFGDPEGYRTATGIGGVSWKELTGTVQFAPGSNTIFRAEVRVDTANQAIFLTPVGFTAQKVYTFGLEAIGHFP